MNGVAGFIKCEAESLHQCLFGKVSTPVKNLRSHLPRVHMPHVRLNRLKKIHAMAQVSYLGTELGGLHLAHHGFTAMVILGSLIFFFANEEVDGV